MKNNVNTLNITAIVNINGYLGIPKGINNAPHIVFNVDKNIPNNPPHKYILILSFYLSYNAPNKPNAIIN